MPSTVASGLQKLANPPYPQPLCRTVIFISLLSPPYLNRNLNWNYVLLWDENLTWHDLSKSWTAIYVWVAVSSFCRGSWDSEMNWARGRRRARARRSRESVLITTALPGPAMLVSSRVPSPRPWYFAGMQFPACPYTRTKDKPPRKKCASNPLQDSDGMMKKCVS